jgi:hypothetical protein
MVLALLPVVRTVIGQVLAVALVAAESRLPGLGWGLLARVGCGLVSGLHWSYGLLVGRSRITAASVLAVTSATSCGVVAAV